MFESIMKLVRKVTKKEDQTLKSKDAAKERLHLVLMQDRANVSADFLELMKQEIIDVIKKYIEIDEKEIDVRLTNKENEDGTNGAPALYANIPILNIKNDTRKITKKDIENKEKKQSEESEKHENEEQKEIKDMAEKVEKNNSQKDQNKVEKNVKDDNKNIIDDSEKDNVTKENKEDKNEEKVIEAQESKA